MLGFFVCALISICSELYVLGGEFEQFAAINCFWNMWGALKRAYGGGQRPTQTGCLLRRLLLLR